MDLLPAGVIENALAMLTYTKSTLRLLGRFRLAIGQDLLFLATSSFHGFGNG
jgi:hypothetical protein